MRGGKPRERRSAPAFRTFIVLWPLLAGWDPWRSPNRAVEEGNVRLRQGQAKEALEAYDRAARKLPASDPALHFNRGAALSALGQHDQAGPEFLRATEARDPALKGAAFYNLGNSFLRRNQMKEAIEAYKRSLGVNPKDERAKWNLELALRRKQEEDKKKQDQKKDDKKDENKKNDDKKDEGKPDPKKDAKKDEKKDQNDSPQQPEPPQKPQAEPEPGKADTQPPPEEQEIEAVLDSLDKSKNLETERAKMRAMRRRAPVKDW